MKQIPLSLDPENQDAPEAPPGAPPSTPPGAPHVPEQKPYLGYCAVGFGVLGIFGPGFVFVPLGLICSIVALFAGQAMWGILGIVLALFGFITSPKLWLLLGIGWFFANSDWDWLRQVIDLLKFGGGGENV